MITHPAYRPFLLLCLLLTGLASRSHAQVGAKISIDSTAVLVGGKRQVTLLVNHVPGIRLLDPDVSAIDTSDAIELLHTSTWDTLSRDDRSIVLKKELLITAWDSGYFAIPALPVPFEMQGRTDTAFTNTLSLKADLAPADTLALQPIKPILEEPVRLEDYYPYFIGLAAALALAALIWWIVKRRKPKTAAPPPPPAEAPPHTLALEKLVELEQSRLWETGQIKEFHTRLTYILREYLEKRFGILALESTTREISDQLQDLVPTGPREEITRLLQTSDMVKFAKAEPPVEVHQTLLEQTRQFIHTIQ